MNGTEIRRARERLGLTIQALADRCRVSRQTVHNWQRDGVDGVAEAFIELLLHIDAGLRASKPKRRKATDNVAHLSGGLANAVKREQTRPRKRRPKSDARKLAEAATGDFINRGGKIKTQ